MSEVGKSLPTRKATADKNQPTPKAMVGKAAIHLDLVPKAARGLSVAKQKALFWTTFFMILESLPKAKQADFIKQVFGASTGSATGILTSSATFKKEFAQAERYIKLMAGDVVGAATSARKLKITDAVIK